MSKAKNPKALIRRGRACVRLIESIDVLLEDERRRADLATLKDARDVAVRKLRAIVRDLDPAVTAEILAASDKIAGQALEVWLN